MSEFVVVGGGIAGLVIARKLLVEGRSVTLVEASSRLGGSVGRHVVGGIALDSGAESFAVRGGAVAALAGELGLGSEIVTPNPAGAWLQTAKGTAVPLPATSLLGIPAMPLATDVTRIIGGWPAFRAYARDTFLPAMVGEKSQTLGELVRARMGDAVLEQLVSPIVSGVHSASPDDLPLDRVAPQLRAALVRYGSLGRAVLSLREQAPAGSAVAGIRGGMSRLVDELVTDVQNLGADIRLNTRASAVTPGSVILDDDVLGGTVVVAASGLLAPDVARAPRVVTLATLVVDAPELDAAPRGTGMLVAPGAPGIRAHGLTHATAKWEWLAERAGGKHVLRLSYREEPENLAEVARADASTLLGVALAPSAVLDFARVQWSRASASEIVPEGVTAVGEAIAGTGLANIIAHSMLQGEALVGDSRE